jgi:hypothetical protein
MSIIRKHSRLVLVAVCCIALGAGASAIAGAGAATGSSGKAAQRAGMRGLRAGGLRRLATRAVHGDVVIATKQGFVTVTFDRGKIHSVAGQQLTITEGTKRASYKTVTLTIPTNAQVRDNRHKASMSELTDGQRVIVIQAPKRTFVIARTPKNA